MRRPLRQRPLRRPTQLGGEARDEQTLIDHLCEIDGLSGDLVLPLKATLSRTHLLTKINFLRGFVKATTVLHQDIPTAAQMTYDPARTNPAAIAQAITDHAGFQSEIKKP